MADVARGSVLTEVEAKLSKAVHNTVAMYIQISTKSGTNQKTDKTTHDDPQIPQPDLRFVESKPKQHKPNTTKKGPGPTKTTTSAVDELRSQRESTDKSRYEAEHKIRKRSLRENHQTNSNEFKNLMGEPVTPAYPVQKNAAKKCTAIRQSTTLTQSPLSSASSAHRQLKTHRISSDRRRCPSHSALVSCILPSLQGEERS